jgi:glycerophosphoryl diester phosphodiesterase
MRLIRWALPTVRRRAGAENTLAGLLLAHRLGVTAIECDAAQCRRVAVITHDAELERTTSGNSALAAHPAQLLQLDAGRHHHRRLPTSAASLQQLAPRCGGWAWRSI